MAVSRPILRSLMSQSVLRMTTAGNGLTTSSGGTRSMSDVGRELRMMYKPNGFQRMALVSSGLYKTAGDIPARVSEIQMKKAADVFRVQFNMLMVFATTVILGTSLYQFRQMKKRRLSQYERPTPDYHQSTELKIPTPSAMISL